MLSSNASHPFRTLITHANTHTQTHTAQANMQTQRKSLWPHSYLWPPIKIKQQSFIVFTWTYSRQCGSRGNAPWGHLEKNSCCRQVGKQGDSSVKDPLWGPTFSKMVMLSWCKRVFMTMCSATTTNFLYQQLNEIMGKPTQIHTGKQNVC